MEKEKIINRNPNGLSKHIRLEDNIVSSPIKNKKCNLGWDNEAWYDSLSEIGTFLFLYFTMTHFYE